MDLLSMIRAADSFGPPEPVATPEWSEADGKVFVRGMSAYEHETWSDTFQATLKEHMTRASLLALCLVDERGKRIFGDDDLATLGKQPSLLIDRLTDVAKRVNGMTEAEAEKNSEEAADDGLPSS